MITKNRKHRNRKHTSDKKKATFDMSEEIVVQKSTPPIQLTHSEALEKYEEASKLLLSYMPENPVLSRWTEDKIFFREFKNYPLIRIVNNSNSSYDNQAYSINKVKTGLIISATSGVIASAGLSLIAGISLFTLTPLVIGGILAMFFDSRFYDGSNRNLLRSLVCKIFLGKKSKQKATEYRKNALLYAELEKPFKLLVESKIAELQGQNVFRIMNEKNQTKPWAFNDNGEKEILAPSEYRKFLFTHMNHQKKQEEIIDALITQMNKTKELSK